MCKRFLIISAIALTTIANVEAKVRLPHLISDNMVLQQNSDVRLWGWAAKGKTVSISPSWSDKVYRTKVGSDGKWMVKVATPKAGYTPYTISFDDGEGAVMVSNVLSGEVWVCAGQSNMEMPVKGFGNCPVEGYNDVVIDAANHNGVHYVKIPSVMSMTPLEDAQCQWKSIDMGTVSDASATGYFFGRLLHKALDIPVGLIEANKGGTRVESWLTEDNLRKHTDEILDSVKMVGKFEWDYLRPLVWGNGTFNPILNFTVKGIIYYQGCSNVGDPGNQYSERLKLLVEQWRSQFALGEIPFYFVQIAPYAYDGDNPDGISGALLREQQLRAMDIIPNSQIVCTNDLVYDYETTQIHPCQKRQVGERLGYVALNRNYGLKGVWYESPRYKEMFIQGDTCYVKLTGDYGAISRFNNIVGFEVAGDDMVFHKAEAGHFWVPGNYTRNETIFVTSKEVEKPVAVRYCFRNFQPGNMKNAAMLPVFPFRTDK